MSISTGTGDDGSTSLIDGLRIAKDHPAIECLGTIDELNAFLGDAKVAMPDTAEERHIIEDIQKKLFTVSGIIAGNGQKIPKVEELRLLIEKISGELPPILGFAIPGENAVSAKLHIARTVCRRLERCLVKYEKPETLPDEDYSGLLVWFNKLSDLLFLLA